MGIALIKKINEKTPYWLKKPFAGIIRKQLINNKVFQETYQLLLEVDSMSVEEKKKIQLTELKKTLIHAYEHTTYYHELFDLYKFEPYKVEAIEELEKLPVLRKDVFKVRFPDFLADDIDDSYLVTTGGTSGEPTKVQMEKNAIYREWAFIYHFWSFYGYDYQVSKLATFRGVEQGSRISEVNPLYQEIRMNPFKMSGLNIDEYNKKIREYGADFIYGYPSAIYNYCLPNKKKKNDISGYYKAALLISENLYPFQEDLITTILNCPLVMFYGHSERAAFAEKSVRGYSFDRLYGVTEISQNSEPIVTGFINHKMPLIRYLIDDKVISLENDYYEIIGHHDAEVLYGKDGEQVSMAAINFHDDTFDGISGYQFIQNEMGKCCVHVTADEPLSKQKINKLSNNIRRKLGKGFECNIEYVDVLESTPRGKYRMLIQNVKLERLEQQER